MTVIGEPEFTLHRLADNRDLTPGQFASASMLIGRVGQIHLGARDYVLSNGLDPAVFLPANIWGKISNLDGWINWTYLLTNFARCASPFSGFDMMMWGRRDVGDIDAARASAFYDAFFGNHLDPKAMDAELEHQFDVQNRMINAAPALIQDWIALTSNVPERYRWRPPPCAGEIGVVYADRILNPDLLHYQSRINALYGAGVLAKIEQTIAERGQANYLEIGPGSAYFAHALRECFAGKLNVFLIDITQIIANGCAYLSCVSGAENIALVTPETMEALEAPYVYLPSHLAECYRSRLPTFDLVHNAISLNEMSEAQVRYYLALIAAKLAPEGVFYLTAGHRILDYHQDAFKAACERFANYQIFGGEKMLGVEVLETPNSFFMA